MSNSPNRDVEVFAGALQLQVAQRGAFLDGACGRDAELRQRGEALLLAHEQSGDFLEESSHNPLNDLGDAFWKQRKLAEAEAAYDEALALRRRLFGNCHTEVASTLNSLGAV